MATKFEKSIDTIPLEDSSIVEKWDSETIVTSALKVNIQKWIMVTNEC